MSTENNTVTLRARELASAITGASHRKGIIMYAPGGKHTITPGADEGSTEVTLLVDQETPTVLNASLAVVNAMRFPQRCFIDKEHEGKEATAWPAEDKPFFWSERGPDGEEAPGVYCRVDFTNLGRQMIDGKVLRAFSPSVLSDADLPKRIKAGQHVLIKEGRRGSPQNPARIIGIVSPDIGTLTNQPAFKKILPLWAKEKRTAPPGAETNETRSGPDWAKTNMKQTEQELIKLRARKTELENGIAVLRAKDQSDAEAAQQLENAQTELDSVEAKLRAHETAEKNEKLEGALRAQREKDAKAAIRAAVKRGAIPTKDEATQNRWEAMLIEDPATQVLLDAIPGSPALQQRLILNPGGARELRASTGSVLRQYVQHINDGQHQEAASIYAREIRPRLKEGDDLPLRAADVTDANLGTLAGTLVSQRVLDLFRFQLAGVLQAITTDFSGENAHFNGAIVTRIVTVPTVETYHAVNGWVQNVAAGTTDVPVTLDKHIGVPIGFNSNILGSTARRLFDELSPAASYALAKAMVDEAYGKILAADFANPAAEVVAPIDFGRRTFGDVNATFQKNGVPEMGRFALLNSDYFNQLSQDPTITNLAVQQASRENILTEVKMPPISHFQPIEAPNLPTTGNMAAFFGHKSSLVVASRVPNDYTAILPGGAAHGLVKVVSDPDTGFTVLVTWYADHQKGTANFRISVMFGAAKGQTKGGKIIKSE